MNIEGLTREDLRAVVIGVFGDGCTCDGGPQGQGCVDLPHAEGCPALAANLLSMRANWPVIHRKLRAALAASTSGQACGCDPKTNWACDVHRAQGLMNWGDLVEPFDGEP